MDIIRVRNLSKVYNGKVKAVNKISFYVEEGEIFGFLGPNGAGKTTTIKMLTTLVEPTTGDAEVFGHSIIKEQNKVRASVGVVPQEFTADEDLTGFDNALMMADLYGIPRKISKQRIVELMKLVDLEAAMKRKVGTYSGGMRRRLELAIGLVNHPRVLFLDEPTLGLDVQTRTAVWNYIKKMKNDYNMTIFMTTHYLEEADSLCDRIAIIDHGKIIKIDSPDKLKASIGGDIIKLAVNDERADLKSTLKKVAGVKTVKRNGGEYRLKVKSAETAAPKLIELIDSKGYKVTKLSMTRPTLDEVYLEYTGRSLREEDSSSSDLMAQRRTMRISRS
ncbi:MAG: ATP-binding cassette domain-containing protein [Candidatus Parvarchaeota archaeon]|nr:ATP-binding cassette domain-containing protein [Candidatus Parvarchaeota archaeon]